MDEIEFRELIKVAAEKMKDNTVYQMLKSDSAYNEEAQRECKAEQKYMELELTKEQKAVCDELIHYKDGQDFEYSTTAYIAGMYDAFRIMAIMFPEKWKMEEISKMIYRIK